MNALDIYEEICTLSPCDEFTFNGYAVLCESCYYILSGHGLTIDVTEFKLINNAYLELWYESHFIGDLEL